VFSAEQDQRHRLLLRHRNLHRSLYGWGLLGRTVRPVT
jgi:hypothetical protein